MKNVLVGGIDAIPEVDETKFSGAVLDYLLRIGLKNVLQDSHASITEEKVADADERKAQKTATALKKLDSLYAGDVTAIRVNATDPVDKEIRAMAVEEVRAILAKVGKKPKDFAKEVWAKTIDAHMAKHDARLRPAAEAKLAIKPEAIGTEDAEVLAAMEL